MRSRLKDGSPSGDSMLIRGRTLSLHCSVPRMWQARIRMEKRTGWVAASGRPEPPPTKRADERRQVRGSGHGARADPDGEEDRLVARLGEAEALLDEARERLQAVAGIEQRYRRFQGGGV